MSRDWGVWCKNADKSLWYEALTGVPMPMTREEAEDMARRVNEVGKYRAKAMPLRAES